MQKHKNRLISILLIMTVAFSIGVSVYADDLNAEKNVQEITETLETHVTAESQFINQKDEYYDKAIGLLSCLNIFSGYEDGTMKPESKITRAEMSAIILRMIKIDTLNEYKNEFSDVDSDHWAADAIQTAYDNNIISGMGDGTFAPDESITYEQAVKMIVCAVNCGERAENSGGYPSGYIAEASRKDINNHAWGSMGEEVTRQTVAKLVYNALLTEYPVITDVQQQFNSFVSRYEEKEGVTILSEKFDIYYVDGLVMATSDKSIDLSTDLLDNQILFEDKVMNSIIENADDLVAQYCRIFYLDKSGDYDDVTAIYAVINNSKTDSLTINAEDIKSIVTGYDGETAGIKYYKDSKRTINLKLEDSPVIVYNDNPFTMANYSNVKPTDENGNLISFDEFITPETGNIRVVDFDKNGRYDIIFVESYEIGVVKLATGSRIQLKYPISIGDTINLDKTKNEDLDITVSKNGVKTELKNLAEDDVLSIKMNANFGDKNYAAKKFISIEATTDYTEGKLISISDKEKNLKVVIDDEEYSCVKNENLENDLRKHMGAKTKFILDKFGRIAYVKSATTGGLIGNEKYAWLIGIYAKDSGSDAEAEIYTQDGIFETVNLATNVDYWGGEDITNSKKNEMDIVKLIQDKTNGFTECTIVDKKGEVKDTVEIRLCKYKLNSNGEISKLYLAVDEKKVGDNSNALRLDTKDYRNGKMSSSMFAGKYSIDNPVPQFTIPESFEDRYDSSIYKYRFAPASEFNKAGDSSLGYNCFVADVSDYAPGIAVRLTGGSNSSSSIESYDTSDDNSVFVITDISTGVDDEDEPIYILEGICDGETVEYKVNKNTLVAHVNPTVRKDKSTYDTTIIWKNSYEKSLTDVLHIGDICGVKGSSADTEVILRMVDVTALSEHLVNEEAVLGSVPST